MRISDWSSDVCSSDLIERPTGQPDRMLVTRDFRDDKRTVGVRLTFVSGGHCVLAREVSLIRGDKPMNASEAQMLRGPRQRDGRSAERRVGKACVSMSRSRWSPYQQKNTIQYNNFLHRP